MASGIFTLLNVSNLDKSMEWFRVLGVKVAVDNMGPVTWGTVHSGDGRLLLFPKDGPTGMDQPVDTREWLTGELGKGVMINVGVPNARKAWEKAQAARLDVDSPLREAPWGGHEFSLVDPDGYVVAVADKFPGERRAKAKPKAKPKAKAARARKAKPTKGKRRR